MSILRRVIVRFALALAVVGCWAVAPVPAQEDVGQLTLVPAPQMEDLVRRQRSVTQLLGHARAEFALSPRALQRHPGWKPALTSIERAWSRARALGEIFSAVAVAEGLSLPAAAFCARVSGMPLSREDHVAVVVARHHLEAMTRAMALSGLEEAHGAVAELLSSLDVRSSRRRGRDESRESLTLVQERLVEAMDEYSRKVLAPFAAAVSGAPGRVTDPALPDRICSASGAPSPVSAPLPLADGEVPAANGKGGRREEVLGVLENAADEIRAAMIPPADLEGVARYVTREVTRPRKVREVSPTYSGRALEACIGGVVILQAVITKEGTVEEIAVLKPLPGLTDSAVRALSRWRFEPATLNGKPVDVYYSLSVNFTPPQRNCVRAGSPSEDPWR